jgi:hypothetical protein
MFWLQIQVTPKHHHQSKKKKKCDQRYEISGGFKNDQ